PLPGAHPDQQPVWRRTLGDRAGGYALCALRQVALGGGPGARARPRRPRGVKGRADKHLTPPGWRWWTCNERIIADPETGVIYLPSMVMGGRRDGTRRLYKHLGPAGAWWRMTLFRMRCGACEVALAPEGA